MDNSFTASYPSQTPPANGNATPSHAIHPLAITPNGLPQRYPGGASRPTPLANGNATPSHATLVTLNSVACQRNTKEGSAATVPIPPKMLSFDSPASANGVEKAKKALLNSNSGVIGNYGEESAVRDSPAQESQASSVTQQVECPGSPLLFTTPSSTPPQSPRGKVETTDGVRAVVGEVAERHETDNRAERNDEIVTNLPKTGGASLVKSETDPTIQGGFLSHATTSLSKKSRAPVTQNRAVTQSGAIRIDLTKAHDEVSGLPVEEQNQKTEKVESLTRRSSRRIKQEPGDEGPRVEATRSNLRRSRRKGARSRKNSGLTNGQTTNGQTTDEKQVTCARCGHVLLAGKYFRNIEFHFMTSV